MELKIGAHISFSKGYFQMAKDAVKIGANAIQYFSRNPRGGAMKDFDAADAAKMRGFCAERGFAPFLVHAPYTYNPAAANESLRDFAKRCMREDLERQQEIPDSYYVFHPGSHVGQGLDIGIEKIADVLDSVYFDGMRTTVLLELMSGKGSEVGSRFGEIARIIEAAKCGDALGVCLDTCHVYSAGYDIVNNLDGVLDEFDRVVGLARLKAIHLNDSMTPFDSHKDRHEKIGAGTLGLDAIARVINHPKLRSLPFYLETPNELDGYGREIALLRSKFVG